MIEVFDNVSRTVEVKKFSPGAYANGEWTKGGETPGSTQMIAIPITPTQLRNLPEGKYKAGDMRFYHKGAPVYGQGDLILLGEVKFEIMDISDRFHDGGFTLYFAKRIYENS